MKDYKAALAKKTRPRYTLLLATKPHAAQRLAQPKKKVLTKREVWALYGLNRPPHPRYEGLKGIYWNVVSEYVRRRDFAQYGTCVSCGKRAETWQQFQAGHFIAAGTCGFALLFDLRNINAECGYCNGFDGNHLIGYEATINARYGKGTAQTLKAEYTKSRQGTPAKAWNDRQYDTAIRELQGELANF